MTDMQRLFEEVDALSAEEIKQLFEYIVENHVRFVRRSAHRGEVIESDDFNDEMPSAE